MDMHIFTAPTGTNYYQRRNDAFRKIDNLHDAQTVAIDFEKSGYGRNVNAGAYEGFWFRLSDLTAVGTEPPPPPPEPPPAQYTIPPVLIARFPDGTEKVYELRD